MLSLVSIVSLVLMLMAAVWLVMINDWRWNILCLAIIYAGVFALVSRSWPVTLALVKLVAGWMAGAILAMALSTHIIERGTMLPNPSTLENGNVAGSQRAYLLFQLMLVVMISLVVFSIAPKLLQYLPKMSWQQAIGGLFLISMGLLHLSLTTQTLRVVLGLLTVLAGFEILYAVVESSTLLAGLLSMVNLGIALLGAYLIMEDTREMDS